MRLSRWELKSDCSLSCLVDARRALGTCIKYYITIASLLLIVAPRGLLSEKLIPTPQSRRPSRPVISLLLHPSAA